MTTNDQETSSESTKAANLASEEVKLCREMVDDLREYARRRPEMVALCSLVLGFALGWKLKLW